MKRLTIFAHVALALVTFAMACSSKPTSTSSPSCNALAACCTTAAFPAGAVSTCTSTAKAGDDAACQGNLAAYSSLGYCSTSGTSSASSGSSGSGGSGGTSSNGGSSASSTSSASGTSSSTSSSTTASSGTGTVGPIIQSLTANPMPVTPTGTTISAIVSDSAGIASLTGGTLIDKVSGTTYGAFATPGGQGTFVYTLTWSAIYQASPIDFAPGASAQRVVTAHFFDVGGHTTSQDLTLTLQCGSATEGPCSTTCEDLASDPLNCGTCGKTCATTAVCTDATAGCACVAGHCSAVEYSSATVVGASCNAMCSSIGAQCVSNVCPTVLTGGDGPHYVASTCSDTTYSTHLCCCED